MTIAYQAPRPLSLWERFKHRQHKPGSTVFKGEDGSRYMFIITSNAYRDREREYITTKALQRYVEKAWIANDVCDTGNTHLFWHAGDPIGDIVWADMEGPFLIEVSKERPNTVINLAAEDEAPRLGTVKQVWDFIEARPDLDWGASHGFRYEEKRINPGKAEATYDEIDKFETSTLPRQDAANELTFSGVIDMSDRDKVLDGVLGTPGAAQALRQAPQDITQVLDAKGVEHKAIDPAKVEVSEDKVKALLDTVGTQTDAYLAKLMDNVPGGLREGVMQLVLSSVGAADEEAPAEDTMQADPAVAAQEQAMGKALGAKQVVLLDQLVETQAGLLGEIAELRKQVAALTPLDTLAGEFKALKVEVSGFKAQLSGRPRIASQAAETVVEDKAMVDKATEQLATLDSFWGVPVKG
jgi:hypothetical protein